MFLSPYHLQRRKEMKHQLGLPEDYGIQDSDSEQGGWGGGVQLQIVQSLCQWFITFADQLWQLKHCVSTMAQRQCLWQTVAHSLTPLLLAACLPPLRVHRRWCCCCCRGWWCCSSCCCCCQSQVGGQAVPAGRLHHHRQHHQLQRRLRRQQVCLCCCSCVLRVWTLCALQRHNSCRVLPSDVHAIDSDRGQQKQCSSQQTLELTLPFAAAAVVLVVALHSDEEPVEEEEGSDADDGEAAAMAAPSRQRQQQQSQKSLASKASTKTAPTKQGKVVKKSSSKRSRVASRE